MKEITKNSLKRFNVFMGTMHLVQGILMIYLGISVEAFTNFKLDIIQHFLEFDLETSSLVLNSKELFSVPFFILVASFLLLSAIAHYLVSLTKLNKMYNSDLDKGMNRVRWFEYALSSSVMIVLISYLFGVYDIASLVLIFFINAAMNIFGLFMEEKNSGLNKENVNWSSFIYGSIFGLIPWVVIMLYMTGQSSEVLELTPWFVWAIVGTYFVAFNTFPINMFLQYKGVGKFKNYLYGERGYIILSLVAKTVLAWLVLFGALQP